jgi:hypothetical protein
MCAGFWQRGNRRQQQSKIGLEVRGNVGKVGDSIVACKVEVEKMEAHLAMWNAEDVLVLGVSEIRSE